VRLNVDVIVASVNHAIEAARASTQTIPIVMIVPSDPVGLGFVQSLSRPGGNITGLTWQTREAVPKFQAYRESLFSGIRLNRLAGAKLKRRRRQPPPSGSKSPSSRSATPLNSKARSSRWRRRVSAQSSSRRVRCSAQKENASRSSQ
jgi:hypothetical protein